LPAMETSDGPVFLIRMRGCGRPMPVTKMFCGISLMSMYVDPRFLLSGVVWLMS